MKWKHTLYTWLCLIPFAALVPVVFSGGWGGDWAFETRFMAACVVLIVMGLWGVFDEKIKALEARLKRLENETNHQLASAEAVRTQVPDSSLE